MNDLEGEPLYLTSNEWNILYVVLAEFISEAYPPPSTNIVAVVKKVMRHAQRDGM